MNKHWPKFETHWTFGSDPNAFGTASGSAPLSELRLGFRPNKPEVIKPDEVHMPISNSYIVDCPRCGTQLQVRLD